MCAYGRCVEHDGLLQQLDVLTQQLDACRQRARADTSPHIIAADDRRREAEYQVTKVQTELAEAQAKLAECQGEQDKLLMLIAYLVSLYVDYEKVREAIQDYAARGRALIERREGK